MSLKDKLKKMTRIGAAVIAMGTTASVGQKQNMDDVPPRREVAELEDAVKHGTIINGEPVSVRTEKFKNIKEQQGMSKALETISNDSVKTYEIRKKDTQGNYNFQRFNFEKKGEDISEIWYPNGQLKSRISDKGESIGYYPNGAKHFEQSTPDSPRSEYYPNGQLITSPHVKPEDSFDYFDQNGSLVAHYHAVQTKDKSNTRQIDIFDEKNNQIGGYILTNYGPTLNNTAEYSGTISEITLPQINGGKSYKLLKPQQMTFDSILSTIDANVLQDLYHEDIKNKNMALLKGSSR